MTANEYCKSIQEDLKNVEHNLEKMIPISVIVDIVAEINSQNPADYGKTYQERSSAESMKQNILEKIYELLDTIEPQERSEKE